MATSSQASEPETTHVPAQRAAFLTTHWSVVVSAQDEQSSQSAEALSKLCTVYWFPLYAYVRRRGYSVEDAQDLTQEFFARVLERQWLARADRTKGRFRTFLLTALERFLANEWDKARALKRGGGERPIPVQQFDDAETRYGVEPVDDRTPDQAFAYRWAVALLDAVVKQLEEEFRARGEEQLFMALKPCLVGDRESQPYAELSRQLGLSESAMKVTVHRLRQRYRELLRAEIGNTVLSPSEVDSEMRHLFNALAGR